MEILAACSSEIWMKTDFTFKLDVMNKKFSHVIKVDTLEAETRSCLKNQCIFIRGNE